MNPLFDEALSFVSDTVRRFYAGTGIEQVVERFSDDLSWIGAGEVEFSTSAEEIVSYLTKRAPLAPPCEVFDEEFYLVNVTECSCTVMGRYNVRTREDSQLVIEERQRCSYELVDAGGELKIRHVHASNPYRAMRDERYFPFEAGRQTYEYLQQLVREKTATIDLLTDNITGGLKMSEDDDVYTLSYVNEGLARMLGYTIEELMEVKPEIVAIDATGALRPGNVTLADFFHQIKEKYPEQKLMADCSTIEEALFADELGFDFIGTTMVGYTPQSKGLKIEENDFEILREIVSKVNHKVIAEGNINTPEKARRVLKLGAYSVVVGSIITRPQLITKSFVEAIEK